MSGPVEANGACEPDAKTLCLHDGRYELQADWRTGDGNRGAAKVVPKATRDSGLFRFFAADNWEVLIKVLDGCAVNGHHWVYGASTTDLGYEIRVRDTATEEVRVYRNEPDQPAPAITDDKAFPGACGAGVSSPSAFPDLRLRGTPGEELAPVSLVGGSESGCVSDGTSLCLADGRFEVKVDWSTAGGGEGSARTVPGGTNNSGLYYFFEPNNWEMLIKVLDGCAINGHYWVYSAAATDLGLDFTVTDTETGSSWEYTKAPGPPAPAVTENRAFPDSCGPLRPTLVSPGTIGFKWLAWKEDVSNVTYWRSFAADFDGDGDEDVLIAPETASEDSDPSQTRSGAILYNNGDFTFQVAAGDRPQGVHPRQVVMADFDGDGKIDFFIADHGYDFPPFPGWDNQLLLWSGSAYIDASDQLSVDSRGYTHSAAVGDIDRDGDLDILVGEWDDGRSYFLMNDGDANFVVERDRVLDVAHAWTVELADLDRDGHLDLVAGAFGEANGGGSESVVYWGSADGVFRDLDATLLPTPEFITAFGGGEVVSTAVRDINGDGQLDILLGGYDNGWRFEARGPWRGVQLLVNRGGRVFIDETPLRLGRSAWSAGEFWHLEHRFFDFNGDGTVDIVPQHYHSGAPLDIPNVMAWLNDGTGHYVALKTSEFDDAEALGVFEVGTAVHVGDGFKYVWFYSDGTSLEAASAFVVEGAVIRRR